MYFSIGDRGERDIVQNLSNHAGKVMRLHDDGRIPEDNPFIDEEGAKPEIFAYGLRNIQGMRDVRLAPDGFLYLAVETGGSIVRLLPA